MPCTFPPCRILRLRYFITSLVALPSAQPKSWQAFPTGVLMLPFLVRLVGEARHFLNFISKITSTHLNFGLYYNYTLLNPFLFMPDTCPSSDMWGRM
jgi:hypothetical protein